MERKGRSFMFERVIRGLANSPKAEAQQRDGTKEGYVFPADWIRLSDERLTQLARFYFHHIIPSTPPDTVLSLDNCLCRTIPRRL